MVDLLTLVVPFLRLLDGFENRLAEAELALPALVFFGQWLGRAGQSIQLITRLFQFLLQLLRAEHSASFLIF